MSEAIERIIAEIAGEKTDGASSLALRGLDAMELLCDELPDDPGSALLSVRDLVMRIDRLRPSMDSCVSFLLPIIIVACEKMSLSSSTLTAFQA